MKHHRPVIIFFLWWAINIQTIASIPHDLSLKIFHIGKKPTSTQLHESFRQRFPLQIVFDSEGIYQQNTIKWYVVRRFSSIDFVYARWFDSRSSSQVNIFNLYPTRPSQVMTEWGNKQKNWEFFALFFLACPQLRHPMDLQSKQQLRSHR